VTTALRADAERNRGLILDAARSVFAEQGLDAGVAEIAERAGVGVGTIFRRFPHKEDLLVAIVEARVSEIVAFARSAPTFGDFMRDAVSLHMGDRCLCESVGTAVFDRPELESARDDAREAVGALLARAQGESEIREDVTVDDVPVIVLGVARSAPAEGWERYLDFALAGLRPS
jgi:AcrR family transcriptional regulator